MNIWYFNSIMGVGCVIVIFIMPDGLPSKFWGALGWTLFSMAALILGKTISIFRGRG